VVDTNLAHYAKCKGSGGIHPQEYHIRCSQLFKFTFKITVSSMGNFLKVGTSILKYIVEKLEEHRFLYLLYIASCRHGSYIVIGYSTNSFTKSEFAIANYCGVEDQMAIASAHIVLQWYHLSIVSRC